MINAGAIIYARITISGRESIDGETPERVIVTEEHSGYGVWLSTAAGDELLAFHHDRPDAREAALEEATVMALSIIEDRQHAKALA